MLMVHSHVWVTCRAVGFAGCGPDFESGMRARLGATRGVVIQCPEGGLKEVFHFSD